MDDLPFTSEGSPPSCSQAVVLYSAPHTSTDHEPSSTYVTTAHQMLPQHLSSPYDSVMPPPPLPRTRKRTRSGSIGDNERSWNRNIGMQQSFHALSSGGSITLPEPPDILYPGHRDYSPSHSTPGPGFPPSMTLPPPQQHHHHYLPPQTLQRQDPHGLRSATSGSGKQGHLSLVDKPGMPAPAPEPPRPKTLFTPENDELIKYLKEVKGLSWPQIMDFFPGRTRATVQVRYSLKLKDREVVWTDQLVGVLLLLQQYHPNLR